jgi:transcription elongation factor Elf1
MIRVITFQSNIDSERGSMVKFHVFTPTVEEFISFFDQQKNIRWKKVWNLNERTIGVYFIEVFSTSYSVESALINIIIDLDQKEELCQIWFEPFGMGMVSPDKAMRDLIHDIGHIASQNKWHFERVPTAYRGDTCPHCNATYVYKDADSQRSTTRTCQNCGKQFDVEEPSDVEKEWGEIRLRRTRCPYCEAVYTYKKSHLQEDGTVVCQNCEGTFVLQIDDWTRYSYEWYQDDDDAI